MDDRMHSMPLLGQDHRMPTVAQMGQEHLTQQKRWQRRSVIILFALFAIIDPGWMVLADPLTPTMEMKLPVCFVAREDRITDKP
jgi:hypothetical protein